TTKPAGALLTLVGDLPPAKMVAAAEKALSGWTGTRKLAKTPTPAALTPGPLRMVHQPGAVQTNIRLGGIGVGRSHPDFPALTIAGRDVSYLRALPAAAAKLTADDVAAAAAKYVAPALLAPVLVGDADAIGAAVGRIAEIEVV